MVGFKFVSFIKPGVDLTHRSNVDFWLNIIFDIVNWLDVPQNQDNGKGVYIKKEAYYEKTLNFGSR